MSQHYTETQMQWWFRMIGKYEVLSRADETKLAKRIRLHGDQEAAERLVCANFRWGIRSAKKYLGRGIEFEDLVALANVGLLEAAYRFDERRGFRFITYAEWWIKAHIMRAIANQGLQIRLPVNRHDLACKIIAAMRDMTDENGVPPADEDIAEFLDVKVQAVKNLKAAIRPMLELDRPVGEDSASIQDLIPSTSHKKMDRDIDIADLRKRLEASMRGLNKRERDVLRLYFGLWDDKDKTLEQAGNILGITRERVRQVRNNALDKMFLRSQRTGLREYAREI